MNGNAELLNYVYQNSQMGTETIGKILEFVENETFKRHLQDQYDEYKKINRECKEMLHAQGMDEKGIGAMEKLTVYLAINVKTVLDKSTSHIAEMLMQGSNMGIIDAIKKLRKYKDADKDNIKLMEKLLQHEEKNVEELKVFL